jgi:aspartyl-tRNA(Asn)/glutamyl-tRNA(Gln) amidotransferase subunit A
VDDVTALTATTLAADVRAGRRSARAITDAFLDHIAATDGAIGAYLAVDADGARAAADAIDAARARGEPLGPLAGVPVGAEGQIVTRGLDTTAARRSSPAGCPPYDATAVERLRAAGAVMLGKLNCDEFGDGLDRRELGVACDRATRGTWRSRAGRQLGRAPRRSRCAGSALTLGTDTGGSIRQPASVLRRRRPQADLRPRVALRRGRLRVVARSDRAAGRGVADAALTLEVIAGADPRDDDLRSPRPRRATGPARRGVAGCASACRASTWRRSRRRRRAPRVARRATDPRGRRRDDRRRLAAAHAPRAARLLPDRAGRGRVEPRALRRRPLRPARRRAAVPEARRAVRALARRRASAPR